ncbi:putative acetyltransferase [Methanoculleus chikugoensis]|uniref:Putative acetyltransferase n=1 Tax=Methanoculleus chikugoensis TaxID=118126 RepID=A0A1M4MIB8_9EURY|nr:GNAT family N-acetyltransferase [Methanoculleus chikugoensis]SCL74617.1 putative acetyltransferase [Methanoculleus chikugoensis]
MAATGIRPEVRELTSAEFPAANEVWRDYHGTIGEPARDRIFATFLAGQIVSLARCRGPRPGPGPAAARLAGQIVSLARCRRHPDGLEVDGVFTPDACRNKGYARMVMSALVVACHNDDLYMYAVESLAGFYAGFGFISIPERDLPPGIRERYTWAAGNMEGAEVRPMFRRAGLL